MSAVYDVVVAGGGHNSLVASGMAKYGFKGFAGRILLGLLDLSSMVDLHRLPELLCGLERRTGEADLRQRRRPVP